MIVYSWDGNTQINDEATFAAWFTGPGLGLPEVETHLVGRHGAHPLIGGVTRKGLELMIEIQVLAGEPGTLMAWFDNEDETPKVLVVADDDGSNLRYWKALCTYFSPTEYPGFYLAKLRVHGDVRPRSVTSTTAAWNVTASGDTLVVGNGTPGQSDNAFPIITLTPRQYSTGQNIYRRFLAVGWRAGSAATHYPVDIADNSLDTRIASTNFASATGDDIRVYVDGVETQYWLDGVNTSTTKVFINLDFAAAPTAALLNDHSNMTVITTLRMTEDSDLSGFPSSGLVQIGSELFSYTSKSVAAKTLNGVTRAVRGTSPVGVSSGAPVTWVQHDIWIEYGNATLDPPSAPTTTDHKPIFDMATSSNESWYYTAFQRSGEERGGAWSFSNVKNTVAYGGDRATSLGLDYLEMGIRSNTGSTKAALNGYWSLFNPCGITNANFQAGEFYHGKALWWSAHISSSADGSSYDTEYTIPSSTNDAWNAWSQNIALTAGARYVRMTLLGYGNTADPSRLEVSTVTVTLDNDYTPTVTIGSELSTYRLVAQITNETTGDAIAIDTALDLDTSLEIDTDLHEVTLLSDGTPQYQALEIIGGARRHLLRLAPGNNTLRYDEEGLVEMDIDINFERRHYL